VQCALPFLKFVALSFLKDVALLFLKDIPADQEASMATFYGMASDQFQHRNQYQNGYDARCSDGAKSTWRTDADAQGLCQVARNRQQRNSAERLSRQTTDEYGSEIIMHMLYMEVG
jgi:hypothetical protein